MSKISRRRGFTLPEVLVTVTIVAVLAAVVVPAVLNQVSKGDSAAVSSDLIAVRTAISTFASDTRRFPGRLTDLGVNAIAVDSTDASGTVYGSDAVAGYKGPYINVIGTHTSPNGGIFANAFVLVTNKVCLKDSIPASGAEAVRLSQALAYDKSIDNTVSDSLAGMVTWHPAVVAADSIVRGSLRVCLTTK